MHVGRRDKVARRIAMFMYGLSGGGVSRRMVTLANAFAAQGDAVDVLVLDAENPSGLSFAPSVRLVRLGNWRTALPFVRAKRRRMFGMARAVLVRYLATERPAVLISADNFANLTALDARRRSGTSVPVIVTQRKHVSTQVAASPNRAHRQLIRRIGGTYPEAEAVVGVAKALVDDLIALGVPPGITHTIHNPVIPADFDAIAAQPVQHPWFQPGQCPVVLGVGRISGEKDFPTLVRAFARARASRPELRLVILGAAAKAEAREQLIALAGELGIGEAVDLPGAVPQAIPYMARAAVFALSSRWEGMPGVLIEAMACGTPVVSTDCPSGPDEILEGGRMGRLVPVADEAALARAILETLATPPNRDALMARGRAFSTERAVAEYTSLIDSLSAAAIWPGQPSCG